MILPFPRSRRSRIRVKAFAVILDERGEQHAVARTSTSEGGELHRPLGGAVAHGERSASAVVRGVANELDATLVDPVLLGVLESIFEIDGERGHEVVFVYAGRLPERDVIPPGGRAHADPDADSWVEWRPIAGHPDVRLVPEGLQELLDDWLSRPPSAR